MWENELEKLTIKHWGGGFNLTAFEEDAKILIKSLLKKQRENCAEVYREYTGDKMILKHDSAENIINAKEPE